MTQQHEALDIARGAQLVRRNLVLFLLLSVVGGAGGFALAERRAVLQTATTKVLVNTTDARSYIEALDGATLSGRLMRSYASIVDSAPVLQRVKDGVAPQLSIAQLRRKIDARPEPTSLILLVTATDADRTTAVDLSTAAAQSLIKTIADSEALSPGVTAEVVDPATATAASTTRTTAAATGLGGALGLVLAALLALARAARDRTVKSPQEAELVVGAPLLGVVPRAKRRATDPLVVTAPASAGAEAFRELRTALMLGERSGQPRSVLITSPLAGDGKSSVAVNLAAALALAGQRVVLVDGDLRRGRLGKALGLGAAPGLSDVVNGTATMRDALQNYRDLMGVISSGPAVGNPSEVLGSQRCVALLEELDSICDVVVVDAPPVIAVTDAVVLSAHVDAVVVVTRHGRTGRGVAAEARRRLARVGADVRGVVINDVPRSAVRAYYPDYRPVAMGSSVQVGPGWSDPLPAQPVG